MERVLEDVRKAGTWCIRDPVYLTWVRIYAYDEDRLGRGP